MTCAKIKGQNLYADAFRECVHLTNIIRNSSFETDKMWANVVYDTTEHLYGNRSSKFAGGSGTVLNSQNTIAQPIVGHVYYGRHYVKTNGNATPADCRFEWYYTDAPGSTYVFGWNNGNYPDWHMESTILTVTANNGTYVIRNFTVNTNVDVYCDGLMIVDLTEAFGSGNEPDQAWCDTNIPYFDGTYELDMTKVEISQDGIEAQSFIEEDNSYVSIVGGNTMKANTFYECITMKNLCQDGSFERGLWGIPTQYGASYDTTIYKYGTRSLKMPATSSLPEITTPSAFVLPLDNTHIYYIRLEAYQNVAVGGIGFYWPIAEPSFGSIPSKTAGQWNLYSYIGNRSSFTNGSYQCRVDFDNNFTDGILYVDGVVIIDLTATFGPGLEPSQAWLDEHVPYFDSTYEMGFDGNSWLF